MSTVVIGGGIAGVSCAYHLAKAGVRDVVLVEKGELTSGSTHHAAGLVTQFNPSPTMMQFRRYSVQLYQELGVFETVGSLRIASSPESFIELRRGVSRAHGIGLEAELVTSEDVRRLLPEATPDSLFGAVWMPGDGYVDPHIATYAVANAARELGVEMRINTRVTGIELGPRREVRAVMTEHGRIEAETVVNAAGMWAPQIAAMVGAFACSIPVDHQHIALHAVEGHELSREMPCFRDTDNLIYGKAESGGVLFGGYEPNPVSRWHDGVPWEHGSRMLPPDHARFQQLMAGAVRRFPFLDDAGVTALVCHPDAMTPDGNPLLGPMPGVRGFWLAAGLSLNGFGGAGGLGRALAGLVTTGRPTSTYSPTGRGASAALIATPPSPPRARGRSTSTTTGSATRSTSRKRAGRRRLSPLHGRLQELGAVFGCKNGWERVDYFRPGEHWRRAGEDQRAFGWARPPFHDRVAVEHAAMRERIGIIDLTSFGKLEVAGADALGLLDRVCGNHVDRPVGSVVYTQLLDERGGIVGDVTVTRLGEERFRIVTGAGAVDSDRGFLELHAEGDCHDRRCHRRARSDRDLGACCARGARGRDRRRRIERGVPVSHRADASHRERGGARAADHLRRRARLRALHGPPRRGAGVGRADDRGVARAGGLCGARFAPHREGLPLLRRRPDELRHAVRGRPRLLRPARQAPGARPCARAAAPNARRRRRRLLDDLRRGGGAGGTTAR